MNVNQPFILPVRGHPRSAHRLPTLHEDTHQTRQAGAEDAGETINFPVRLPLFSSLYIFSRLPTLHEDTHQTRQARAEDTGEKRCLRRTSQH